MNAREGTAVSPVLCLELPGETAARLRDMRWSGHLLGQPADWSRELQSAVQLLLSSSIPALLFWGEARILFFNDAFADNLDDATREAALAVPAAQGLLALWRRHWPWIESLFAGSTVRTPRTDEKGGVFSERAEITHVLLGDPANRYARGGLLLMNPAWGKASQTQSSIAARHLAVLEAIDEGFCVIEVELDERGGGRDYRFLDVNPAFERLTGFVGAVGRSMREIAPATEQYWFDRFAQIARTGESVRFENEASQIAGGRWYDVFAFRVDEPEDLHVAILFSDITERKNSASAAAEALTREREANALLDAISDSAPIGLAFLDRDLRFRRINARLAEMNALPAAAHIGKRADELLPGVEGLAEIVRRWEEILRTGEPWLDVDVIGETPAQPGVVRSWSENFFPVRVDGKIVGIGVVVEDTTERRLAQEALAASEARFRALIELGPVGIALSQQDGRVLLANDAFLRMMGYTRAELPTLNWIERTAPESLHLDMQQIQSLREGKLPDPFEKEYIRRDGTRVAALVAAQFLPGEGERMMAYAIDITDRRAAEQAVRESEARLRHLIDHMAGFVSILDRQGTLLEIGEPALRAGGLTRAEVLGRKFWECEWWTHDPVQQKQIEQWFHEACQGATIREDVIARVKNDGRLDVDMMLQPVFDATGEVTHVIPSGVDISDRKRIELALRDNEQRLEETAAALKDADRRKDDFLATLAHELRNPLAPIRNGIQILRLVASSHVTLERTTSMMERQMQHLVRLVDDLLDVSRITRGKIELRKEVVLVNEIVSSALESCETLFEPHGHTLSVVLESEPLRVRGDPDRLRQVFSNLLSNAAKFTPREGTVWVTLERAEGHALVKVRDSGIGIPQERLGHIFEMFAQIHAPHGNDGLGIGLALVKQLVNLHHGTVRASSEGVGKGSEFTVCLPLLTDAVSTQSVAAANGNGAANGRRILVVDENLDAAESLASVLSLHGHVVRTAPDGAQALASAEREPPDVVLMDLGLPGMDGLTAARMLRAQPGGHSMRIIALTGWGQEDDRERTRAAGIDVHLVKPVNTEDLLEILERGGAESPPAGPH